MKQSLQIITPNEEVIGSARIMCADDVDDAYLVDAITDARNRYREQFLTQFTATPNRTRNWMRRILAADDRMLFMLENTQNLIVGHYGLIFHDNEMVELDNSIIWSKNVQRKFMAHVEHAILNYAFGDLARKVALARLLDRNFMCVAMHRTAGFVFHSEELLVKNELGNGDIVLQPSILGEGESVAGTLLHWLLVSNDYKRVRAASGYPASAGVS